MNTTQPMRVIDYGPPVIDFPVPELGRQDDALRRALAEWCLRNKISTFELSAKCGLDSRTGWRWLSGRSDVGASFAIALLNQAGFRILAPDDAQPLIPARSA